MLFDIGANLTDRAFSADLEGVLERAKAAGVMGMALTGTTAAISQEAARLAGVHRGILWSTAGVHPHHAADFGPEDAAIIRDLLTHDQVVAVGECGLDYNRNFSPRSDQLRAFRAQLDIAAELQAPTFVHERDAAHNMIEILTRYRSKLPRIVVHCFTGSIETLRRYIDLDLYIGITGWICDERRGMELRDAVSLIPANRLLIETDAPYLLPRTIRPRPKSRRNEPAHLVHVADMVAECRGCKRQELDRITWENSVTLFGISV